MLAYVTSIGEPTTELCVWSLERNGFDVKLLERNDSLAQKLQTIYADADKDFVRVDADVIVNRNLRPNALMGYNDYWWLQFMTFDWYKQDLTYGGVQFIRKSAIPLLRLNIDKFLTAERPESQMYRLDEFINPRRCMSVKKCMGLHGYAQNDIERVKETKARRGQKYDWELYEKVEALCSKY